MTRAGEVTGLTAETGVAEGIRLLVRARFREFRACVEAAGGGIDSDGLHDTRIACRRLSWALREFKLHIPKQYLAPARRRLRAVAAALGALREEDAAVTELEKLAGECPAGVSAGVRKFAAERRRQRSQLTKALAEQLGAGEVSRMEEELSTPLGHVSASPRRGADAPEDEVAAATSFSALCREIIRGHLSEVEVRGGGFLRPDNRKALRRMRRAVRELRYSLESLESYGRGPADEFDDELGRLQTALGKVHDRDVWLGEVCDRLRQLDARPRGAARRRSGGEAAVWLLKHFTLSRAEHFCEALAVWDELRAGGLPRRLKAYVTAGGLEHGVRLSVEPPSPDGADAGHTNHGRR